MQQTTEYDEQPPIDPASHPFPPVSPVQVNEHDDDPEIIFAKAVAEIDTQPLPRPRSTPLPFIDLLHTVFCLSLIGVGLFGIVRQAITYPHTLVVLSAKEYPASLTTTLALPTRTLAPVTITRSATIPTTGYGHQNARAATGTLMFYNGSATPQYVPGGSVFTGNDEVKVTTEQSITVPAANLPAIGSMAVSASALLPGSHGNIAAYDVDSALSPVLKVRNEAPFTNGREARRYPAAAPQDVQTLTATVNEAVAQAFTAAFPLQQGEEALPTTCQTTTSATHHIGDEAQSVTVTSVKTCSAMAYDRQQVERQATAAFTQTRPAATYHLVGSVETTVKSVSPLTVSSSGKWVYTFSQDYEQSLAERIAGDTPAKARAALEQTGVIAYASIPNTLPPDAMYINFVVLVG